MQKASTKTIFVGLDVHKDNIVACWVNEDGEDEDDRRFANDPTKHSHADRLLGATRA